MTMRRRRWWLTGIALLLMSTTGRPLYLQLRRRPSWIKSALMRCASASLINAAEAQLKWRANAVQVTWLPRRIMPVLGIILAAATCISAALSH